jgi:YD repeat-containing protein
VRRRVSYQALKGALLILVLAYVGVLAQGTSKVEVNRRAPNSRPPSAMPVFSSLPTVIEITRARVFEEPLLVLGAAEPSADENRQIAGLITGYLAAGTPDGTAAFEEFLASHPNSPWRDSLLANLGVVWRRTGHFSKAYDAWERVWLATKDYTDQHGHAVADKALGEYVSLNARLGRFDKLRELLQETNGRNVHGSAWEQVSNARQALWMMDNEPEHSFRCGPLGLDAVLSVGAAGYKTPAKIAACPSTKRGTSLLGMRELAKEVGASMTMAKREASAEVILPALVHWKVGHFAALVEKRGNRYLMKDPTFGDELWLTEAAIDEEATGYFLVRTRALPDGWSAVGDEEGAEVWGKGVVAGTDDTDVGGPDGGPDGGPGNGPDGSGAGGGPGDGSDGGAGGGLGGGPDGGPSAGPGGPDGGGDALGGGGQDPGPCPSCHPDDVGADDSSPANSTDANGQTLGGDSCGMPTMSVHRMLVSLTVRDTPLWYAPPRGPLVRFRLRYNQREAFQPQTFWYSNVGQKWTHGWLSYITDDPSNPGAAVTVYLRGGGQESDTGYNPSTLSYSPNLRTLAVITLTSTSPIRYERQMPNGVVEVFSQPDGAAAFPRRVFLTEIRDPHGNALTFTYDTSVRLIAVADALGQVTTLAYGNSDPLKITQVTDPFGRTTTLSYDVQGRLQSITDMLGLASS